jgi:hypothetical protein
MKLKLDLTTALKSAIAFQPQVNSQSTMACSMWSPTSRIILFFGPTYAFSENNFDAASASVYMGYGFRSNFSVRVRF